MTAMPQTRLRTDAQRRAALAFWWVLTLALVPAYLFLAPAPRGDDPVLVATLLVLAVLADRAEIPTPSGAKFDAILALTLICVALVGPLPALGVTLVPSVVDAVTRRKRFLRVATLGNLAATGWQAILAALLLAAVGTNVLGLAGAGVVLLFFGWLLAPAIWAPLWLGVPFRAMVDAFFDMRAVAAIMIALATVTVLAYPPLGVLALALFALVAVLPQSALTYAARTRPVARLDTLTATRRYAAAIGRQLGLDRGARRKVDHVVRLAHERGADGDPTRHLLYTALDGSEVSCAAGHVSEWWNGAGGPAGIPGGIIPLPARITAVARTWAALTAADSPELGHQDALDHLDDAAGVRLDPAIVRAARAVIAQERSTPAIPAPEPRLHHLGVPAALRRAMAAES
jgi:hypothetical protein